MKLYLDNSFLNRPFDDPTIALNRLEGEALLMVIEQTKKGKIRLVNSSVIEYENSLNPFPERKQFIAEILELATEYQNYTPSVRRRAAALEKQCKLTPFDARHLACAEAARVDFFITCDYTLTKQYKGEVTATIPSTFVYEYENHNKAA